MGIARKLLKDSVVLSNWKCMKFVLEIYQGQRLLMTFLRDAEIHRGLQSDSELYDGLMTTTVCLVWLAPLGVTLQCVNVFRARIWDEVRYMGGFVHSYYHTAPRSVASIFRLSSICRSLPGNPGLCDQAARLVRRLSLMPFIHDFYLQRLNQWENVRLRS